MKNLYLLGWMLTLFVGGCGQNTELKLVNDEGSTVDCNWEVTKTVRDNGGKLTLSTGSVRESRRSNESFTRTLSSTGPVTFTCSKLDQEDTSQVQVQITVGDRVMVQDKTNLPQGTMTIRYTPPELL